MKPEEPGAGGAAPLLSIVTVCFNSARTIGQTLQSVDFALIDQAEVEHVIVDGKSTDQTLDIVASHSRAMRRLFSERDTGIYAGMNKGLRIARGEYVWFLNSDDYLHPALRARWQAMLTILRERRSPVLVGEVQMFKEVSGDMVPTRYWRAPKNPERARRLGWHPPHPAFVADREFLLKLGGFDESKRIAADIKLMEQAMAAIGGRASAFPHVLVAMREGGVSNKSIRSIMNANRECYVSLRELGVSTPKAAMIILAKLMRKAGQKLLPARGLGADLATSLPPATSPAGRPD
ncbi:MAG TPA: glycosyltransferase family 2 protein [Caldimonas sp.]|jgi:glycosyltransferase|nr:glycosyltransferase family 2 protein [Caldimonas sp.]HEX2542298.1 glycosyltransferase family 2 protein [Caldimonas sp.]